MKLRSKLARRLPEDAFERAIELGERLESGVVGNLTNTGVGIEQFCPRSLGSNPAKIIGEGEPGAFVKGLAEMENTRACRRRDIRERNLLRLVRPNVLPRFGDQKRFTILLLDDQLIAQSGKLFGEKSQQPNDRTVRLRRQDRVLLPGAPDFRGKRRPRVRVWPTLIVSPRLGERRST